MKKIVSSNTKNAIILRMIKSNNIINSKFFTSKIGY